MAPITLEETKARLKIPDIWLSLNLPGDCSKNPCHSPFYARTNKPSFSVFQDGNLFHDFRTGDKGDQITFLQLAMGLAPKEACRRFVQLASGRWYDALSVTKRPLAPQQPRELPTLPPMRGGTQEEHKTLATLRNLDVEAIQLADEMGVLRFGKWRGFFAWFITEPGGRNAQARRLDGKPWEHINAKAQTLPRCWASWPIGATWGNYQIILLCEGGPDWLAAVHFILKANRTDCFPVAMLGAAQKIHPKALPWFAGKRVRIFNDGDKAGRMAARKWAEQLATVGARVDAVDCGDFKMINGQVSKDLNDLALVDPNELTGLLPDA